MRGWAALHQQTALQLLGEVERLDPDNPIAAMARTIFEAAADEGVRPSGRPPSSRESIIRQQRAERRVERQAEYQQAVELYATGQSLLEVGKALGHSPAWVSQTLVRMGSKPRRQGPGRHTQDLERVERLRAMRADGKTLEQMGAAEHITRERVRQICAAHGIDTSPNTALDERQQRAVADYVAGDSLERVANTYEVGTAAVRNWILRAGLVPRRTGSRRISAATKATAEKAATLYRRGVRAVDIAAELGLHHQEMIYRLLAIAGVRPNRNTGAGKAGRLS